MLSDTDCEELALLIIEFSKQIPDKYMDRRIKSKIGASHSLILAGVRDARPQWENMLGRFLFWLHSKNIPEVTPSDKHKE